MEPTLGNFMNYGGGSPRAFQLPMQTAPIPAPPPVQPVQQTPPVTAPIATGMGSGSTKTKASKEPSPIAPSSGDTQWQSIQPVDAGNNMTSLGASLGSVAGGAAGGPLGYVAGGAVGGGAGYLVDSFISAREKEEKKKELERQMRLTMMKQRYENSKAATAQRLSQIPGRMARWDARAQNTSQINRDKLNRIYSSIENRVKSGFLQGA